MTNEVSDFKPIVNQCCKHMVHQNEITLVMGLIGRMTNGYT